MFSMAVSTPHSPICDFAYASLHLVVVEESGISDLLYFISYILNI